MENLNAQPLAPRRADFSILIPAFNQSTALEQSLPFLVGNLLTAKFSFEILISDNASTDDTWRICKDWSKSTKEIKVFLQRTNLGFLGNIRFLANNSTGNFVIILGCGDLLSVSLLNAIMPLLIEGQPHSLVCGVGTHRSIDWGLEPVIEGPIKTTKLCMLSKNAPYQEAISGNIFGNGNGELSRQLARDFQTGDVWPHLEIQMEAYLDGETILRTEANLVSMMQDSKSWYNNQALSRSFYRRHLVLLLPNSFKSVGLLVKTLSLLTVGLWSLLLKRRPPRPQ